MQAELVYCIADDTTLMRRYTESRRRHPLAPQGLVSDGIAAERTLTARLRAAADMMVETSSMPLGRAAAVDRAAFRGRDERGDWRTLGRVVDFVCLSALSSIAHRLRMHDGEDGWFFKLCPAGPREGSKRWRGPHLIPRKLRMTCWPSAQAAGRSRGTTSARVQRRGRRGRLLPARPYQGNDPHAGCECAGRNWKPGGFPRRSLRNSWMRGWLRSPGPVTTRCWCCFPWEQKGKWGTLLETLFESSGSTITRHACEALPDLVLEHPLNYRDYVEGAER